MTIASNPRESTARWTHNMIVTAWQEILNRCVCQEFVADMHTYHQQILSGLENEQIIKKLDVH